ncbi:putative tyrosinase [Chaetomium tenue]|uniref:Tyrosinase n=1 Tax=Chaetomium tenue TaxID=1854479 RepID=A0ACB7P235_9PEZI|nr:putative tyrosinase [Chaetomium globosum]
MMILILKSLWASWIKGRRPGYNPVAEPAPEEQGSNEKHSKRQQAGTFVLLFVAVLCILLFATESILRLNPSPVPRCTKPHVRREWRALTTEEKKEFIRAVNVLAEIPSRWTGNGTIYDDFAILHGSVGSLSHRSASFLPWHRYTLILYENALREYAGFTGRIPYWDWSLDWMNMANSSIWDSVEGFGGDGHPAGPETVGEGRCVTEGPFAHLRPIIYNHTFATHCLSRGFHDGNTKGRLSGEAYKPEKIGEILRKSTYKEFSRELEIYLHGALHQGVNGDFKAMTAANDPLFFLHHAQLDRTWWRWQQEDPRRRMAEYEGKHMFNSTTSNATVNDMLLFGGFAKDIPVQDVMNTEGGLLCYRY